VLIVEVQPAGDEPAQVVFDAGLILREGQHLVVVMEVGELEPGRPAHRVQRLVQRDPQLLGQDRHLGLGRCSVEAAHPAVDRMDRPAADQLHDRVAGLLQRQPSFDQVAAVFREGERTGVAEEVGGVQQLDVQCVTLDPLSAVEQPTEIGDRSGDLDPAGCLDGQARAHLVGHRADPADARGDVRRFGVLPPAQERLEEPRRLVDLLPHVLDGTPAHPDVHRAFTLDRASARTASVRSFR
jgi:hypothetical protein